MEPLNERELDELLEDWKAPNAPADLEQIIRRKKNQTWWRWLFAGSVRIPVPVLLMLLIVIVTVSVILLGRKPRRNGVPDNQESAHLQPVKRLEVRIIRSNYESNQ